MLRNKDINKTEKIQNLALELAKAENVEQFTDAQMKLSEEIMKSVLEEASAEANKHMETVRDEAVLHARGLRTLTNEEMSYYSSVLDAGFEGVEKTLPATVIDRVFESLTDEHPLLKEVQIVNASGLKEFVVRKAGVAGAEWGKLTDEIKKKLEAAFEVVEVTDSKLSAYIPVPNAYTQLGALWLDKYVRTILTESIAIALENTIVAGNGVDKPTGMINDLDGSFQKVTGYPAKSAETLADFKPATLGKTVMKPITEGKVKNVGTIALICNPADYWEKIFPQTVVQSADGHYVFNVLPIDAKVIQSVACPVGKIIAYIPNSYYVGISFNEGIKKSEHVHFLEDETVYVQRLLATGRLLDNKAALVFDISTMK